MDLSVAGIIRTFRHELLCSGEGFYQIHHNKSFSGNYLYQCYYINVPRRAALTAATVSTFLTARPRVRKRCLDNNKKPQTNTENQGRAAVIVPYQLFGDRQRLQHH